jgi:hypothetical protein
LDALNASTATASRPQDWDDFNPLFGIFPQIYYNGTRLTKTANEEKFRDVLRQVYNSYYILPTTYYLLLSCVLNILLLDGQGTKPLPPPRERRQTPVTSARPFPNNTRWKRSHSLCCLSRSSRSPGETHFSVRPLRDCRRLGRTGRKGWKFVERNCTVICSQPEHSKRVHCRS